MTRDVPPEVSREVAALTVRLLKVARIAPRDRAVVAAVMADVWQSGAQYGARETLDQLRHDRHGA